MFKKKWILIFSGAIVVLLSVIIIYSNVNSGNETIYSANTKTRLVDVDKVVENPEKFSGIINVEGTVKEVIVSKKLFTLECEDGDANLPISYSGKLPEPKSNIIASGEVKKDIDGKYFFAAMEIRYK